MPPNAHRACDDFHATREATRRSFLDTGITRRQILARGIGAGLAVYASRAISLADMLGAAEASAAAAPDAPVLVSVFLPGGCDLLDSLVPLSQYGRYADLRPKLKQKDPAKLGSTGLGVHPSLELGTGGGVKGLFDRGKVGLLPGIDYANPDLSHFHSRHFWESGLVTQSAATGWLGRMLDRTGSQDNPLQGISLSSTLSPLLRTAGAPVAAVSSPNSAQFWIPGMWGATQDMAMATYAELAARPAELPGERAATGAARLAKQVADRLAPYRHDDDKPDPLAAPVEYPKGNDLGGNLAQLAGLLSQPLGIRVAAVEADGQFDTHDAQPDDLSKGLKEVSEALSAFQADLEARGLADRVLTFVWSEFGRRPQENESSGTDHGAGGLAWVQGTRVRSGVLTDYPDLSRLDREDNLAVTVDFRRVYSSLLEQWMGTDAGDVIPNAGAFGRLDLVA
ncbi:MAG: hypothetical protein QOE06_2640 [Thermoleophilaceae bacterium]|jgi:uncharacterized protein (DUF1501 family)|nr:hypothetical protein [Thermoleophilaceae bacterium]